MEESPRGGSQSLKRPRRARTLAIRVLAGAVLIPVALLVNHTGGLLFAVFVSLLAGCGSYEFYRMLARKGLGPSMVAGVVGSVCVCFSFYLGAREAAGIVLTVVLGVVLVERLIRHDRENFVTGAGITMIGVLYTGWLLGYFILIRNSASVAVPGRQLVYLVLALTWSYDSIAYFAGSSVGRHKLFSRVSPSKTAEGTIAGLVACVAAALISRATFAPFLSVGHALLLGVLVGVAAQAGDLVESMIKRSTGTKDSSQVIPGHGGILDRFDSLLFTGPAMYFCIRLMITWNSL
ncbi:MAG: phosphatidate cytidylyltransferase [Candidatus Eisenbacteria bacterium]